MHLEFIDVSGIAAPRGGVIYDTIRIHMHALKNWRLSSLVFRTEPDKKISRAKWIEAQLRQQYDYPPYGEGVEIIHAYIHTYMIDHNRAYCKSNIETSTQWSKGAHRAKATHVGTEY